MEGRVGLGGEEPRKLAHPRASVLSFDELNSCAVYTSHVNQYYYHDT